MDNSNLIHHIPSLLGITTALFFSGTHFSASQLTLPTLYKLPSATSTSIFSEFYYRGIPVVVPLALSSSLSFATAAILASSSDQKIGYGIAAAATIAPLAWTQAVIRGVNLQLIAMAEDARLREKKGEGEVKDLLKKWKWMNNVRAGLALVGGVVGLSTFVREMQ